MCAGQASRDLGCGSKGQRDRQALPGGGVLPGSSRPPGQADAGEAAKAQGKRQGRGLVLGSGTGMAGNTQ